MTWRERIQAAQDTVATAYEFREAEFKAAHASGLTLRQIAEAAGLTAPGVHKIVGKVGPERVSLDDMAPN